MKQFILKVINSLGYGIYRINAKETDLYHKLFNIESIKQKRFYNIGAGSFWHPYWTNVDYESDWYAHNRSKTLKGLCYDLLSLKPIPLESSSAEIIYSSHTIEHITNQAAENMFRECYRILKKSGTIRLTAPDIDLHFRAYKDKDKDFFYWAEWYRKPTDYQRIFLTSPLNQASIEQLFLQRFATSVCTLHADGAETRIEDQEVHRIFTQMPYEEALNYCISKCPLDIQRKYPGNHINWWNKNKTIRMLKDSGFEKVYISGYGQSFSPILRNITLFDNTHPKISFYVEAIK